MLKKSRMRKATGSYCTYSSLVKLQPWFLSLGWKTCVRQNCCLGFCACSEGPALGQNTLMMTIFFENVEKFKYLAVAVTNTNDIREEIKRRKNMGNAHYCFLSFFLSLSVIYPPQCRFNTPPPDLQAESPWFDACRIAQTLDQNTRQINKGELP